MVTGAGADLFVQRAPRLDVMSNDIWVRGPISEDFPETRWREAILSYLFAVWSGRQEVAGGPPKISFGGITLQLDPTFGGYWAYGISSGEGPGYEYFARGDEDIHVRSERKEDVEVGLIRFVKDNRIKLLTLWLPNRGGPVTIWKKSRRGQYGCGASTDLPKSWADAEERAKHKG